MKKKIWIFVLALYLMMTPVTAMAAPAAQDTGQHMESAAAQEALNTAILSTFGHNVRIINYSDTDRRGLVYQSEGSGVIIAMDGNMIYISTAAHCLKNIHTKVQLADGLYYDATVGYRNPAKDVGFVLVPQASLSPETLALVSPAAGADAAALGKVKGDVLFSISSADSPNELLSIGKLDVFSVPYPNNPKQNVMQFYSDATFGSSGGGVYTQEGIWIGSVSGGDTFGKCWAVPYADILSEFNGWLTMLSLTQSAAA